MTETQKLPTQKQHDLIVELGYAGDIDGLTPSTAKALIDGLMTSRSTWRESAKERAKSIDMIELASRYTELRRESSHEQSGPCPRCNGTKRFHVQPERWFCRDCHPAWGDAIEFIRWMESCTFDEALTRLTDGSAPAPVKVASPTVEPTPEQADQWKRKARAMLADAQERLYKPEGKAGLDYLLGRGLDASTLRLFGLGYVVDAPLPATWNAETKERSYPCQPAIVIPWYADGDLVAVRFRFLEKHTYQDTNGKERKGEKQSAVFGSSFGGRWWGEQSISRDRTDRTLVIVEGEINAMSIYQVAGDAGIDICSIGSESAKITPAMIDLAGQYRHIILWADRQEITKDKMNTLPGAFGLGSPNGKDANDLLQAGHLGGFLAAMRVKGCAGLDDRINLARQMVPAKLDAGAVKVLGQIDGYLCALDVADSVGQVATANELPILRARAADMGFDLVAVEHGDGWRISRLITAGCTIWLGEMRNGRRAIYAVRE